MLRCHRGRARLLPIHPDPFSEDIPSWKPVVPELLKTAVGREAGRVMSGQPIGPMSEGSRFPVWHSPSSGAYH
jgi:hypothetical protein